MRFEKAENRAVRDAVPEIYGSPDNEGDSSASVMASVTLTDLLCLQPAYSLRTVLCDSAAKQRREKPRAFNQFNYSL